MLCPRCGYMMDAFDKECPRCACMGTNQVQIATKQSAQASSTYTAPPMQQPMPPNAPEYFPPVGANVPPRPVINPFLVVLLIGIGMLMTFIGYRQYAIYRAMSKITPLVHNISIREAKDIDYEISNSSISYGEFFDTLEDDIKEIDGDIVDMQAITCPFISNKLAISIKYAKACQELMRAQLAMSRKQFDYCNAIEWYTKTGNMRRSIGWYDFGVSEEMNNEARNDATQAETEYHVSLAMTKASIDDMIDKRQRVTGIFAEKYLIDKEKLVALSNKVQDEMRRKLFTQ